MLLRKTTLIDDSHSKLPGGINKGGGIGKRWAGWPDPNNRSNDQSIPAHHDRTAYSTSPTNINWGEGGGRSYNHERRSVRKSLVLLIHNAAVAFQINRPFQPGPQGHPAATSWGLPGGSQSTFNWKKSFINSRTSMDPTGHLGYMTCWINLNSARHATSYRNDELNPSVWKHFAVQLNRGLRQSSTSTS